MKIVFAGELSVAKILIVEDDQAMSLNLEAWLVKECHSVDACPNGEDALDMLSTFPYELIIMDWEMPTLSGVEVLQCLRGRGCMTPVLMLTGRDDVNDKALGLDAGADDYLTKPFHFKELIARIRALLRRPPQISPEVVGVRHVTLDAVSRRVLREGVPVHLQPMEFSVFEYFLRHPDQLFSPEQLLNALWDSDAEVSLDAIYTCMRRLRRKLDVDGQKSIIRSVHGIGYGLDS